MKTLFEFEKKQEKLVDDIQKSTGPDGAEISTTKKIKKEIPFKFAIVKPTRTKVTDAEAFYNVCYSKNIKDGMLTRAQILKRIGNDNGAFTETEIKEFDELKRKLAENRSKFQILHSRKADLSGEEKTEYDALVTGSYELMRQMRNYEIAQESLFTHSAENFAFKHFVLWWILNISFRYDEKNTLIPVFKGKTYEEKCASYDEFQDSDDEFIKEVSRELFYLISFWVNGAVNTSEEFEKLLQEFRGDLIKEKKGEEIIPEVKKEIDEVLPAG